jgi:hypothetical protein
MTTEVHRVVLYVVDHDQVGAAGVREMLEYTRYPNRCIAPHVVSVETQAVEWDDDHPLNTRATAAAAFAELFPAHAEHAQRPAVPGVEEAIQAVRMRSFEYGGAADARPVEASYDSLRAAIAQATHAAVAQAIHDQNTGWQAHDLERDAEVARWQHEAHVLVQAIKSIALTAGVDDVPNGDGWAERTAAAVNAAITRTETQLNEVEAAAFIRGRDVVRKYPDGWGLIPRPTPDEARRLVDAAIAGYWDRPEHIGPADLPHKHDHPAVVALLRTLGAENTQSLEPANPLDAGVMSDMDQPIALLPAEYDRVVALLDTPGEPTAAMRALFAASARQPVAGWGVDSDGIRHLDAGWLSAQVEPTGAWEVYVETICRGCDDINDIDAVLDGLEGTPEAAQLAAEDAIREITTAALRIVSP